MNKYVVKFGDYYFCDRGEFLDKKRLFLTKDMQSASWLTEKGAHGIAEEFGGEALMLNIELLKEED